MKAFGDENEATPDSARSNHHPSSRTDVSSIPATSEPSNLTPPPTVTESKSAEPPTGEEDITSSSCPWQQKENSKQGRGKGRAGAGQGRAGRPGQ